MSSADSKPNSNQNARGIAETPQYFPNLDDMEVS